MEGMNIYSAITATMKDIGIVGKNDTNDYDHYKFRGIDAVMNALNPAMIKNHIFAIPTVLDCNREERIGKNNTTMMYTVLTVKYTFYAEDGSSVDAIVIGEAMDRSDKSTNKAMSAAFKYACFQTFCIPTEELLEDADKESPEIGQKTASTQKVSKPARQNEKPQEQPKNADKTWLDAPATDEEIVELTAMFEKAGFNPRNTYPHYPNITKAECGKALRQLKDKLGGAQ